MLSAVCAGMTLWAPEASAQQAAVSAAEAREIARDAFIYAYPLVLSGVTFDVGKNVAEPIGTSAPLNQFGHMRQFPDASFTIVVRPNADTLYSSLGYDVTKEPLIISVPASGDRYYLLPFLDMWSDIFHGARHSHHRQRRTDICDCRPKVAGHFARGRDRV